MERQEGSLCLESENAEERLAHKLFYFSDQNRHIDLPLAARRLGLTALSTQLIGVLIML